MATINYDDGNVFTIGTGLTTALPGHGRSGPPVMAAVGKVLKVITGQFSFDASYPTGGEDIADIFSLFGELRGLYFDPSVPLTSAGTGKKTKVDYTGKKLLLYDNAIVPVEVAAASDQSGSANVRFLAWGYR